MGPRAALWSFVVPIASFAFRSLLPDSPSRKQTMFLFYEALFTVLMLAARFVWPSPRTRWGKRVVLYVVAYYALWALSDALILGLHLDVGYLLRVVPNVLYYGGLLAAVSLTAPERSARHASSTSLAR